MSDAPTPDARYDHGSFVEDERALAELSSMLVPVLDRLIERGILHPRFRPQDGARMFSIEELHARRNEILFALGLPATEG